MVETRSQLNGALMIRMLCPDLAGAALAFDPTGPATAKRLAIDFYELGDLDPVRCGSIGDASRCDVSERAPHHPRQGREACHSQ